MQFNNLINTTFFGDLTKKATNLMSSLTQFSLRQKIDSLIDNVAKQSCYITNLVSAFAELDDFGQFDFAGYYADQIDVLTQERFKIEISDELYDGILQAFEQSSGLDADHHGACIIALEDGEFVTLKREGILPYFGVDVTNYAVDSNKLGVNGIFMRSTMNSSGVRVNTISLVVISSAGKWYPLSIILNRLTETNEVFECISKTLAGIINGDNFESLATRLNNYAKSKYASIREFVENILTNFKTGGVQNIISVINSIYKKFSTMQLITTSDDDVTGFQFTDNEALTPQVMIWGLAAAVGNTVLSVASAALTALGGIVGVIGNVLLGIGATVFKAVEYSATDVTATLIDSFSVDNLVAPVATLQRTYDETDLPNNLLLTLKDNGMVRLNVPEGILYIGYLSDNLHVGVEFHPYFSKGSQFGTFLTSGGWKEDTHVPDQPYYWFDSNANTSIDSADFSIGELIYRCSESQAWEDRFDLANASTGHLSQDDDMTIRKNILLNTACFLQRLLSLFIQDESLKTLYGLKGIYANRQIQGSGVMYQLSDLTQASFIRVAVGHYNSYMLWATGKMIDRAQYQFKASDSLPSWTQIVKAATVASTQALFENTATGEDVSTVLEASAFWLLVTQFGNDITRFTRPLGRLSESFGLAVPTYDSVSAKWAIAAAIAATVTVAAVTAVVSVKVNKAIKQKQAKLQSQVYNAQTFLDGTDDPGSGWSKDNYSAYRKAVFKNNMFSKIFGGTQFSKTNVWNSVETDSSGVATKIRDYVSNTVDNYSNDIAEPVSLSSIYTLITGVPVLKD